MRREWVTIDRGDNKSRGQSVSKRPGTSYQRAVCSLVLWQPVARGLWCRLCTIMDALFKKMSKPSSLCHSFVHKRHVSHLFSPVGLWKCDLWEFGTGDLRQSPPRGGPVHSEASGQGPYQGFHLSRYSIWGGFCPLSHIVRHHLCGTDCVIVSFHVPAELMSY